MLPEQSDLSSLNEFHQPGAPTVSRQSEADATGLRRQAAEIVEAVLAQTSPEHAPVRDQLRKHLAANPGRPEIALAEHLASLGSLADYVGGVRAGQDPASPELLADPDGAARS